MNSNLTPLELLRSRLPDLRQARPGQWYGSCPAHDDDHGSLSVAEGATVDVVVNCFAGCTEEDIWAAVGLPMSARSRKRTVDPAAQKRFGEARRQRAALADNEPFLDQLQEVYGWDRAITLALPIGQPAPGQLSFFYSDHRGAAKNIVGIGRSVPSHLRGNPFITALPKTMEPGSRHGFFYNATGLADGPVSVFEGAGSAISGMNLGMESLAISSATCNLPAIWFSLFRHRDLYLFPDADDAGRKLMARVAQAALDAGASSVAVVDLLPELRTGEDIADVLREEGRERTVERAQGAMRSADVRFPEVNRGGRPADAMRIAVDYLTGLLADGQWHRTTDVLTGAPEISNRTMRRARQSMEIERRKNGGHWEIRMPKP